MRTNKRNRLIIWRDICELFKKGYLQVSYFNHYSFYTLTQLNIWKEKYSIKSINYIEEFYHSIYCHYFIVDMDENESSSPSAWKWNNIGKMMVWKNFINNLSIIFFLILKLKYLNKMNNYFIILNLMKTVYVLHDNDMVYILVTNKIMINLLYSKIKNIIIQVVKKYSINLEAKTFYSLTLPSNFSPTSPPFPSWKRDPK